MKNSALVVAFLSVCLGCSPLLHTNSVNEPMSKPFSHRVFSAIEAETIYKEFPFIGITPPFWTPSEEDTALLDGTVNELRSLLMKRGMDIDLRDYEWQHIGFYRGSDKVIYANLFCRDAKHDPSSPLTKSSLDEVGMV